MKPVLLIDLSSVFWPNWHASAGNTTDAAFVWSLDAVRRIASEFERIAVCVDHGGKTFRHELSDQYKANRPEADAAAIHQLRRLKEQLAADGFPLWSAEGYEADDVIASAVGHFESEGCEVVIFSADKDLAQLVASPPDGNVTMVRPAKSGDEPIRYDVAKVTEKFGVPPWKLRDWLAIVGDTSDNVPGVKGIGPKGATALLTQFESIDELIAAAKSGEGDIKPAARKAIVDGEAQLLLSRKLVSLHMKLEFPWSQVDAERKAIETNMSEELLGMGEPDAIDAEPISEPAPRPQNSVEVARNAEPTHDDDTPKPDALAKVEAGWERELEPRTANHALTMAKLLFASRTLQGHPNPESVWSVILAGRSMGIDAMTALRGMHVIKGKVCMSAQMMHGLVLRSPCCEYFSLVHSDDKRAEYVTKRRGAPEPTRMTWTIDDARKAGLIAGGGNWEKYPRNMLRARCVADLARAVYPDIICNLYDPDEMA